MSILVRDSGFSPVLETPTLVIRPDENPQSIALHHDLIGIEFLHFADGRGFSIARALRRRGYKGRLRAMGYVISDQYAMLRRVGFDEMEISQELADRQPQKEWQARANWQDNDYQRKLGQNRMNR